MTVDFPAGRVDVRVGLSGPEIDEVIALAAAAAQTDAVQPLSEHVMLHLRYGGEFPARSLLLRERGGALVAYAHLDITDPVEGPSAELVVDPGRRGRGYGRELVRAILAESPDGRLRLWAHGGHPGAAALATSMGFERSRELRQLRRPLDAALPEAPVPPGVTMRTFQPGRDDQSWLELNARAFADHPEQGGWTMADLQLRMREPWFSPAGFFLAARDEHLVGFHWTKVHGGASGPDGTSRQADGQGDGQSDGHGHEPIGEIYVLGVDPAAQSGGLGRALSVVGLRHLRALGLPQAMLYVDADNAAALRLYTGLGFTTWDTDVMFRRRQPTPGQTAETAAATARTGPT